MSNNEFLRPRLIGPRFEGSAIPLEVLADLAILSELLVEAAKWRFIASNPGRKRSPRGFAKGVELKLVGVEGGSAVPVIALVINSASLFPPALTYMEEAREAVIEAIDAASSRREISLPEPLLAYFDRLGRSLREDEAIEFNSAKSGKSVRFDKATRRTLLLASSSVEELTDATTIRGFIPEADQARKSFEIATVDGRKIAGPLTAEHRETILEAFNGYRNRQRVAIDCIGRFNRASKLVGIEAIEQITLLDPLDIAARLDELGTLRPGWLDGEGKAPDPAGLAWLDAAFEQHYPDDVPAPHLYPTPDGNVQAEWSIANHELSLDIDPHARSARLHALNLTDDSELESQLNLVQADDWKLLVKTIRQLGGGL